MALLRSATPSLLLLIVGALMFGAGHYLDETNLRTISFFFFGAAVPAMGSIRTNAPTTKTEP